MRLISTRPHRKLAIVSRYSAQSQHERGILRRHATPPIKTRSVPSQHWRACSCKDGILVGEHGISALNQQQQKNSITQQDEQKNSSAVGTSSCVPQALLSRLGLPILKQHFLT